MTEINDIRYYHILMPYDVLIPCQEWLTFGGLACLKRGYAVCVFILKMLIQCKRNLMIRIWISYYFITWFKYVITTDVSMSLLPCLHVCACIKLSYLAITRVTISKLNTCMSKCLFTYCCIVFVWQKSLFWMPVCFVGVCYVTTRERTCKHLLINTCKIWMCYFLC